MVCYHREAILLPDSGIEGSLGVTHIMDTRSQWCYGGARYGYDGEIDLYDFILTGDVNFYGRQFELIEE